MKPNQIFISLLAITALFAASCSTSRLAQNANTQDDVYNTTAQAREYKPAASYQNRYSDDRADTTSNSYASSDSNYDMDYASRIDRFYYGSPYRGYYDPYYNLYDYNYFGYSPYYSNFGLGLSFYYGSAWNRWNSWYNPYNSWSYYGSPYYWNTWGPYSYYNPYGGFLGGGYYGGYYGGGYYAGRNRYNPNYGPRPSRSVENRPSRTSGYMGGTGAIPSRGSVGNNGSRPSRAEMYNPNGNSTNSTRQSGESNARPSRGNSGNSEARPTRTESRPAPTYNPPPQRSSPPPSNSGGSNSSGSSGGARPSRGRG